MNLLKNVVSIVKETAEEALHTTPLEKALYYTTSNLSVIPAISDMELIADHTNYYEDSKTIIKYINKKLKRDNPKRIILRTLDLVDYLIKHGAMRIVHEIRDEKYQLKSLRNLLGSDDENEMIELITKKTNTILELLSDEKKLEEERETASQTKNRYKGTGNTTGFGSSSYGGESYEGMGSDGANRPKKRYDDYGGGRDRERERDRDDRPTGSTGGKYDPSVGESNLMRKLGLQPEKKKDGDIDSPGEESKPTQAPQTKQSTQATPAPQTLPAAPTKTAAPKFLPPPPSKSGAPVSNPGAVTKPTGGSTPANPGADDLLGFDLSTPAPAPVKVPTQPLAAPKPAGGNDLLGMDLLGGPSTTAAPLVNTQQRPAQQTTQGMGGFNTLGGMGGNMGGGMGMGGMNSMGGMGSMGGMSGIGGMGSMSGGMGTGMGGMNGMAGMGGMNSGMGGMNSGMGGGMGGFNSGLGMNSGMQGGMGMNSGMNTGMQGGMGMNSGLGSGMGMGMGSFGGNASFGTGSQQSAGQKKLVTFDNKTNDDFGTFQEAKPKTAGLKNFSNAEADLIDLSDLTNDSKKSGANKKQDNTLGLAGW